MFFLNLMYGGKSGAVQTKYNIELHVKVIITKLRIRIIFGASRTFYSCIVNGNHSQSQSVKTRYTFQNPIKRV